MRMPRQLANILSRTYDSIQTLSATVDLQASVGGTQKGTVTDYTSFRGFILLRKPEMLRVIGLLPMLRTQAFDLVSDGSTFKLYIPSKTEAIEGKNSLTAKSPNHLLNLRPNMFFDSMLIRQIEPDDEVFLTTDNNVIQDPKTKKWVEERDYLLWFVRAKVGTKRAKRDTRVDSRARVIRFSSENLQPIEQVVYDAGRQTPRRSRFMDRCRLLGRRSFPGRSRSSARRRNTRS